MKSFSLVLIFVLSSISALCAFAEKNEIQGPGSPYDGDLIYSTPVILTTTAESGTGEGGAGAGTIIYKITNFFNQDIQNHGLDTNRKGWPAGITQTTNVVQPYLPVCTAPTFSLAKGESCYLMLAVDGSQFPVGETVTATPTICVDPNHPETGCNLLEDSFTFGVSDTPIVIEVEPSGCDSLGPNQNTSWQITNTCSSTPPYNNCDPDNLIAYGIDISFSPNIDTFINSSSIDASLCAVLGPGQSCLIFAKVNNTVSNIDNVTAIFKGSNTTTVTDYPINIGENTGQLQPVGTSTFFFDTPGDICNTYQNCGGEITVSQSITNPPSGVTYFTNVNDCVGTVAADATCQLCYTASQSAYGNGTYTMSYSTGSFTGNIGVAGISLTMNDDEPIIIPSPLTSDQNIPIVNNGKFNWQNASLAYDSTNVTGVAIDTTPSFPGCENLAPGSTCNPQIHPGTPNVNGVQYYTATGTNVTNNPVQQQLIVGTTEPIIYLGDPSNGHLQYREIIIDNTAGSANATLTSITVEATTGSFLDKVYVCQTNDSLCDFPSTCDITNNNIEAGDKCSIWVKSLTPSSQAFTDIPQGTISVNVNSDAVVETFNLAQQVALYTTGYFNHAGSSALSYIAKWDGTKWNTLDYWNITPPYSTGGDHGLLKTGNALAVFRGDLFVGGQFVAASLVPYSQYLARWNGSEWSAVSTSTTLIDDYVNSVAPVINTNGTNGDNYLYFGGEFKHIGSSSARHLGQAQWNGSAYNMAPLGNTPGYGVEQYFIFFDFATIYTLITSGTSLYAGGVFYTTTPPISIFEGFPNNIALWNGSSMWSPLAEGVTGILSGGVVYGLAESGNNQYVAGTFDVVFNNVFDCFNFGPVAINIARWDSSSGCWHGLNTGFASPAYATTVDSNGTLYAGGSFVCGGTVLLTGLNHVAKYSNGAWHPMGAGLGDPGVLCLSFTDDAIYVLKTYNGMVYAGGTFDYSGSTDNLNNIAYFDGTTWNGIGGGVTYMNPTREAFVNDILITSSILLF